MSRSDTGPAVQRRASRDGHLTPDVRPSLADLADVANREHTLCEQTFRATLEHAIVAGEALREARDRVGHGGWLKWCASNFDGALTSARRYMRLAEHRDRLDPNMTMMAGLDAISGLTVESLKATEASSPTREDVVRRVRAGEVSRHAAAAEVGVGYGTIQRWVDPEGTRKHREAARKRQREAREALERQQRAQEIKRAVRKAGAALAEAYAMAERMQDVLAQSEDEVTDKEARAALARAGEHYRRMRDEIVRALGVG